MVPKFVRQPYLCPNMRLSSTRRCRNIAAKEMLTTASSAESQAHSQSSQKHPQHFVLSELISRKGMSFHPTCYHHWIPLNSTLGSVYILEKHQPILKKSSKILPFGALRLCLLFGRCLRRRFCTREWRISTWL